MHSHRGSETLLVAAYHLEQRGLAPCSLEDLIVEAWKLNPNRFGLRGRTKSYPDANRVSAQLSARAGVVRRGYLLRIGPGLYQLSAKGRQIAKARERAKIT
jgi:hypothetical protein